MEGVIKAIVGVMLVTFGFCGIAHSQPDTLRVLFIGNSYTYYHSMPYLFKAMAENKFPGRQVDVQFIGGGGATLQQHWKEGRAPKAIKTGRWDFVVLQEQSMLGTAVTEDGKQYVGSPEPFFEYAERFARVIKEHGAKPVFYMTWARQNQPGQQKYLTYAYMRAAEKSGSLIAPVGIVWQKLRDRPDINPYEAGGSHPSVAGSFTAAAMIFAVIFDSSPTGILGRLQGHQILGGGKISSRKIALSRLPETQAAAIEDAIAEVYQQLKQNGGYLEVEKAVSTKRPSTLTILISYVDTAQEQIIIFIIIISIFVAVKGGRKIFDKHIVGSSLVRDS